MSWQGQSWCWSPPGSTEHRPPPGTATVFTWSPFLNALMSGPKSLQKGPHFQPSRLLHVAAYANSVM